MSANGTKGTVGRDEARSRADTMLHSLKQTATLARNVEDAASRLASSGNEQSAASQELRVGIESMAASIEEISSSGEELARSQKGMSEVAKSLHRSSEAN